MSFTRHVSASRGILLGALVAVAAATGPLGAARTDKNAILETSFLVIPNKPIPGDKDLPQPADIRALVGKKAYEVRSVTRASESKDLKIMIVFDLESTLAEERPCLLQQAEEIASYIRGMPRVETLLVHSSVMDAFGAIDEWNGRKYEAFVPGMISRDACAPLAKPQGEWSTKPQYGDSASTKAFRGLAATLGGERGPVAIIWAGQTYSWFSPWDMATQPEVVNGAVVNVETHPQWGCADCAWSPELAKAGTAFFPVIWLNGRSVDSPGAKASFKFASQIASSYGGRVTFSEGALASSVGNIVESVQKGWIVEVVGPSRKYGEKKLPILELSYAPDPSVFDMKHDFARMAEVPAYLPEFRANDYLYAPNVALFDTEWLRGKAGCDAAPGTAAAKWMMAALVPEAIGRQTAELPTRVAFAAAKTAQEAKRSPKAKKAQASPNLSLQSRLDSQPATAQADPGKAADDQPQERTRLRSQSTEVSGGPKGSTEVCINLPPTTAADGSYLVMVFDPVTKWSGVGILPLSDVLQYQQEHGLTSGQK